MNIKKRSVWFLTLISLVAVITVFYVSDQPSPFDGLKLFSDDTVDDVGLVETTATNEESFASKGSNAFEEMRMEVENKRSQLREQLTTKVGTNDFTAEEKAEYFTQIQELTNVDSAEGMLELIIKSIGYDDALVRIDDSKVLINVVASELSTQQANEIIYAVKQEWPKAYDVRVEFTGQ